MKLRLLNSSETVQMSLSGGEAVSLSLKTGAVQTGGSLSIGHGLKWESGDAVETDNTLPVTSAAVAVEVGNIAVLLGTI